MPSTLQDRSVLQVWEDRDESRCNRSTSWTLTSLTFTRSPSLSAYDRDTGEPSIRHTFMTPERSALTTQLENGVSTTPNAQIAS